MIDCLKTVEKQKMDFYKRPSERTQTVNLARKEFLAIFDWENEFYKCIEHHPEYQDNLNTLMDGLTKLDWKRKFSKRGVGFFYFVKQLTEYIQKALIVKEGIPYYEIPGYEVMTKTFIFELHNKPLSLYTDAMMDASSAILNNTKLLPTFITIILKKTS